VPKPRHGGVPLLVTGRAQQSMEWIARHADAWVSYPREPAAQAGIIATWQATQRTLFDRSDKPFAQSLYLDLDADPDAPARRIHLGYRLGRTSLLAVLGALYRIGVGHVALNLKYGKRPASEVLEELGAEVVPHLGSF
jgi:luciferase-type oxidoreductase